MPTPSREPAPEMAAARTARSWMSKQGVVVAGDMVLKWHPTAESARLEVRVARLYSTNRVRSVRIPTFRGLLQRPDGVYVAMARQPGRTAVGLDNPALLSYLVDELALFHERFSHSGVCLCPRVLYRDAIRSNYILDERGHVHIDFSSSSRFVHCWDDLALLLHPRWGPSTDRQRTDLVHRYIEERRRLNGQKLGVISRLKDRSLQCGCPADCCGQYLRSLADMARVVPTVPGLAQRIEGVDFCTLRLSDYETFFDYRDLRATYYANHVWRMP